MKSTGTVRKIDPLGRIVLPAELRKTMNLPELTPMEIFTEGNSIILTKYERGCVFCGSMKNITVFKDKLVCSECRQEVTK